MIFNTLAVEADTEWVMIDSSIIRSHQHAERGARWQETGKSGGGFSTKVQLSPDALGCPTKVMLTPGNISDCTQAIALLEGQRGDYVIADKGYDSQSVVEAVEELGAEAVIPSRSFRKESRSYDRYLYKQ